jgi:lysophospholipase L1-like esterase
MKKIRLLCVSMLFFIAAEGFCFFPEIIFFGDSIMWQQKWSKYWDRPVENKAVPASRVVGIMNRAKKFLDAETYKAFFEGGINDILLGRKATNIAEDYEKMIKMAKIKAPNAKIYIISVLPIVKGDNKNKEIITLNSYLEEIAESQGATFIDLHQYFVDADGITARRDLVRSVHLMPKGQQLMADKLEPYIN